jgi:hypothetical protein
LNGEEVQYFLERGTQIVSLSPDFTRWGTAKDDAGKTESRISACSYRWWGKRLLTATRMKVALVWDVATCSLVDADRRFGEIVANSSFTRWRQ